MSIVEPRIKRYWVPPPIIESVVEYQDVNKDVNLRKDVSDYFYNKVIKWVNTDSDFIELKNKLDFLKSNDGYIKIYNILRKFVKKTEMNWYDLRKHKHLIKNYLKVKLTE